MQPSNNPTESSTAKDSSVKSVLPSITIESPDSTSTFEEVKDVQCTELDFDVEDMIADVDEDIPSLPEIPLETKEARQLVQNIVRERELNEEAYMPSGDEHLLKQTQAPLLVEIKRLTEDNRKLSLQLEDADPTTAMTPEMIRKAMKENTRLLLDIRKELTAAMPSEGIGAQGITIDIGNVFNEALQRAKEHSGTHD